MLDRPFLIIEDFNCILGSEDKKGGKPFHTSQEIKEFRKFLRKFSHIDMGYQGLTFTWCNNRLGNTQVWEGLDRAFASQN